MARATPHVSPSPPTSARVGQRRPGSATRQTRRRRDALAELLHQVDSVFEQAPELAARHHDGRWAIPYLETVPGWKPPLPPMNQAEQVKLAETQADEVVQVILAILDGLGLSAEDWERGHDVALRALRAVSVQGWNPL